MIRSKALATRVARLREEKGWTQTKLAQEAKVAQSAISDIEQAQRVPRIDTLDKISAALGVSVADLLEPEIKPTGTEG